MGSESFQRLVDEVFEQEALVIGGIVATHDVDDDVVWALVRGLDSIRCRILTRLDVSDEHSDPEPHPAIEKFLLKLRVERKTTDERGVRAVSFCA